MRGRGFPVTEPPPATSAGRRPGAAIELNNVVCRASAAGAGDSGVAGISLQVPPGQSLALLSQAHGTATALAHAAPAVTGTASLFAFPWSLLGLILLLVAIGVGIWFYFRWRRHLRRAELAAVAARASRDTERRLLGGRTTANGHSANGNSANGHSANGAGAKPPAGAAEAKAASAEAAAPGGTPDGGGPATEGTTE
ncbi:MAG TPA: hypothetical protein VN714_14725 [Trebonia sp.]|nr:hypothetical protein [Trebonia sp.]